MAAGISFLVLLVALKFLESHALRDYFVVCLLLYFLAASSFLFDSSIASISIIVLYALGITSILLQISNPSKVPFLQTFKSSLGMVAKALPLAVLLFFFFPRISGDFGFLPSKDQRFTDGLSDALVAGEMAAAAFNTQLAFRAEFKEGEVPPREKLYWRVKTMSVERNFQWEITPPERYSNPDLERINKTASLDDGDWFYEILHESTSDAFIPYLDYVSGISRGYILRDYSVNIRRKLNGTFSYKGTASSAQLLSGELTQNLQPLLRTRSEPTARLQALVTRIRENSSTDAERINLLYQYFVDRPYKYSLTPPGLNEFTPLDDFVFNTRTGYCEHYASAFTTLARWLGVPSRIVAGYQGGEKINNGQYVEVRYSDAHAWSEVWIDQKWQRVDPTAAVRPDRIELGMNALRELWDMDQFDNIDSSGALANFLNPTGAARVFRQLQDTWKSVGYQWNKWVVNYDIDTQRELLENLGFKHKSGILTLVLIMMTGKAQSLFPLQGQQIHQISLQFQELRYGALAPGNSRKFEALKRQVKKFKLSTNKNE